MISQTRAFAAILCAILFLPLAAVAQTTHWVQIEAHATLRTAEEFAARYESRFGRVAGFRVAGGWYALTIGPFATPEQAEAERLRLLDAREIRGDAYVTDARIYGQQFWPVGGTGAVLAQAPAQTPTPAPTPAPVVEPAPQPATPQPVQQPVTAAPEPAPQVARMAEPVVIPQPVAPTPEPEPEPEETLAQARANDAQLSRDDRAAIQTALQWFGHYTMAIDAAFGPGTRRSIGDWQAANGFEATGFLTTRQLNRLLGDYEDEIARYGFAPVRDTLAGIEATLPLNMVAFARHETPFAHYDAINNSGIRILLISQEGSQATMFGLYEIMQTLEVIPMEGRRERRANGFVLTGQSATARAHAVANLAGGQIKGYLMLWEPRADADAELVRATLDGSLRSIAGVLPANAGTAPLTVARRDLLSGLDIRRPERSRSGFFVDAVGTVVTTAEAVDQCGRVTIDEAYLANVRLIDRENGIAVLIPAEPLVPLAFAQFASQDPGPGSDVRVAGFSYQDTLTRPILTFGGLSDLTGLNGEPALRRLAISVQPGDSGGPVFDAAGGVMGMLLPRMEQPGRMLPEDVHFAVSGAQVLATLEQAQLRGTLMRQNTTMPAEILTRVSADLTVLVSCWN